MASNAPVRRTAPVSRRPRRSREGDGVGSLTKSFGVWGRSFVPVTIATLLVHAPIFVFLWMVREGRIEFSDVRYAVVAAGALTYFLGVLASGAVTYGVLQQLRGHPVGIGASVAKGFERLLSALATGLLTGLVVAIGLLLLVVPGIIALCGLSVAVPAAIAERRTGTAAMGRSWALTAGAKGSIFLAFFLFGVMGKGLELLLDALLGDESFGAIAASLLVTLTVQAGLSAVFSAVLYHDLRVAKEGVSADEIAHVFD